MIEFCLGSLDNEIYPGKTPYSRIEDDGKEINIDIKEDTMLGHVSQGLEFLHNHNIFRFRCCAKEYNFCGQPENPTYKLGDLGNTRCFNTGLRITVGPFVEFR